MPTTIKPGLVPLRALWDALEQMSDHMFALNFSVMYEMPYISFTDEPMREGATVRVSLDFVVPADIAEKHGFQERQQLANKRGLPGGV